MPAIDALQELQTDLIRKSTSGSVFLAPYSADSIDEATLFDAVTGDLAAAGLPTGYDDLGYLTDAGAQFARSISTSDVTSWQSQTPTRSDITADTDTLQVACQETKLKTVGLYLNADTSALVPGGNGVLRVDKDPNPVSRFYRALSVAVDEQSDGEIVICHYLPKAEVTAFDNQNFAKGTDPVLWGVTLTGRMDDVLGTAGSYIFGGAGWKNRLAAMGFGGSAVVPVIATAAKVSGGTLALNTAGGQLVRITGRGFTGTTAVKFVGTNATEFDVVDDTRIDAITPAHAAGSGPVVVQNATGPSTTGPTATYS